MTEPAVLPSQRRRQATIVLVLGLFGLVVALVTSVSLPVYFNSQAVTDGHTLYFVAQGNPDVTSPGFFVTQSTDGSNFKPWSAHTGRVSGSAALGGRLYCVFPDGSGVCISNDWEPLRPIGGWRPLGIGVVDNHVTAFAQTPDHAHVVTAVLDNLTWHAGPTYPYAGDNIGVIQTVRCGAADYLIWLEIEVAKKPVRERLGVALPKDGKLKVFAPLEFDEPMGFTAVGADNTISVYCQTINPVLAPWFGYGSTVNVVELKGGAWDRPREVAVSAGVGRRIGDFSAVRFRGKTMIYSFHYWFGLLYAGLYGTELRGGDVSDSFLVLGPSSAEVIAGARWLTGSIAALFAVIGALAGFARLRKVEKPAPAPERVGPAYASVVDRAVATGIDLGMIYGGVWFIMQNSDPLNLLTYFVTAYIAYCVLFESSMGGQTPGKMLLSLRVVTVKRERIAPSVAVIRNILKLAEIVTVGLAFCLWTERYQRPGDLAAGTVVIKELPAPRREE